MIDDVDLSEQVKVNSAPASTGFIWVKSTPPAARILVDGAETGLRTPARLELQAGAHEIRVVRFGFGTAQKSVTLNAGQTVQVSETLGTE